MAFGRQLRRPVFRSQRATMPMSRNFRQGGTGPKRPPVGVRSDVVDVGAGRGIFVAGQGRKTEPVTPCSDRSEIALRLLTRGHEVPTLDCGGQARCRHRSARRSGSTPPPTAWYGEADRLRARRRSLRRYLVLRHWSGCRPAAAGNSPTCSSTAGAGRVLARNDRACGSRGSAGGDRVPACRGSRFAKAASATWSIRKDGLFLDQREPRCRGRLRQAGARCVQLQRRVRLRARSVCKVIAVDISETPSRASPPALRRTDANVHAR